MVGDNLYINGQICDEPYIEVFKQSRKALGKQYTKDFDPVLVPEGEYFVLGDNRDNSLDSRMIGTISKDNIVGKAGFVFYPFTKARSIY